MASNPSTAAAAPPTTTTTTLQNLTFSKKNTHLLHIPSQPSNNQRTYRIEKRPIPRAPVASPYAGSHVPKIVYVGSKTPFMSAVKRVQKLLRHAERRAMMPLIGGKRRQPYHQHHHLQHGAKGRGGDVVEKCQQRLREDKVLVKATGRAIEKAVGVGRWFEEGKGNGGEEYEVCVRTGSVCVVDDIVEDDVETYEEEGEEEEEGEGGSIDPDIAMSMTNTTTNSTTNTQDKDTTEKEKKEESKNQRRRRRKRERIRDQRLKAFVDQDGETPESRTRWVNMVEIAINMK